MAVVLGLGGAGAAASIALTPPPAPPVPTRALELEEQVVAEIPPAAAFLHSGPFEEPALLDAFFAPDGRRYTFLFLEGGPVGVAGAGRLKTANNLEINGRRVHLGLAPESQVDRQRAGWFERTDRFWYIQRSGEQERLVLEDREGALFDRVGPPAEAFDGRDIAFAARLGDEHFVVVEDWRSAPYDQPITGPWFSPNGDAFAYLVGGKGERLDPNQAHVVICERATNVCNKRPNHPHRTIEEFLTQADQAELFFALLWYSEPAAEEGNASLEELVLTKRGGRWQYGAITRATSSLADVPLGDGSIDLTELAAKAQIPNPHLERIEASSRGEHLAMVVAGPTYVAGDGVIVRRDASGHVKVQQEYVRCKYGSQPFARREWLVVSDDASKIAYCLNEPSHGERIVVNETRYPPYSYILSPPVLAPDGSMVAYYAGRDRTWWAVVGAREYGPYDELFGAPRFTEDGRSVWFGARRARELLFVKVPAGVRQPADEN